MAEADLAQVRARAIRLLARREHSRLELTRKLQQRGLDSGLISAALDDLAQEGLQSDQRYADSLINSRIGRGQGPLKIRAELNQGGVDDALVEAALKEQSPDWSALASQVRRRRFGAELPAAYEEKVRQARFLSGRGFASDTIWQVLGGEE